MHQNTQKFTFPAGNWNKVVVEMDSYDAIGFDLFKLTYDNNVIDFIEIEGCETIWFDRKDLYLVTEEAFECYHKTAKTHREFALESYHPLCSEGFERISPDESFSCYRYDVEKRTRQEAEEVANTFGGSLGTDFFG